MKNIFILSVVAVAFLTGCQSAPAPADLSKRPPTEAMTFIGQMRQKYGGDASKLSPEERAQMDKFTHGNTDLAMKLPAKS